MTDLDPWVEACWKQLRNANDQSLFLVDRFGNRTPGFTNDTFGMSTSVCNAYCGPKNIPLSSMFNFAIFFTALTGFFLPWLALSAQLPFDTGRTTGRTNITTLILSLGSPALVAHSLAIFLLNHQWVRKRFDNLVEEANHSPMIDYCPSFKQRIYDAVFFLGEVQQVPLRLMSRRWIQALVQRQENEEWWSRLRKNLNKGRRKITKPLVAQLLLASASWTISIIMAFELEPASKIRYVALQIAAASLWLWLIPITWGWTYVGVQNASLSLQDALIHDQATFCDKRPRYTQRGYRVSTKARSFSLETGQQQDSFGLPLKVLHCRVDGDEGSSGPIFIYARLFTWTWLVNCLHEEFKNGILVLKEQAAQAGSLFNGETGHFPTERPTVEGEGAREIELDTHTLNPGNIGAITSEEIRTSNSILGTSPSEEIRNTAAANERTDDEPFRMRMDYQPYAQFGELGQVAFNHFIIAWWVGTLVQWGTTGPALLIAYLTPTIGFGCRSIGIVLYGSVATLVHWCLLGSMVLSHWVMIKNQNESVLSGDEIRPGSQGSKRSTGPVSKFVYVVACTAVILRIGGKALALCNTTVLVLASMLEYTGVYQNCWCRSRGRDHPGLAIGIVEPSTNNGAWTGGLTLGGLMCCLMCLSFLWAGRKKRLE